MYVSFYNKNVSIYISKMEQPLPCEKDIFTWRGHLTQLRSNNMKVGVM